MISLRELIKARAKANRALTEAGIALTPEEAAEIEVADFGMGDLETLGLQLVTYLNTERVCAKELIMMPWQTCPEHRHPSIGGQPGKEETFRCRAGMMYLYVPGKPNSDPQLHGLENYREHMTSTHEIILLPGDQYTLLPDTPHWFRAGPDGAVVSEFSTTSTDEHDIFTDPRLVRSTEVLGGSAPKPPQTFEKV